MFKRPIGASGVVLALALTAAACGSDSTDATAAVDSQSTAESSADSSNDGAAPASTDDGAAAEPETQAEPEAESESEGPSPAAPHSFPDLETVTISDGAPVNLADELAGGDTPVLLWFFAPH